MQTEPSSEKKIPVLVVVPCYNEEQRLKTDEFLQALQKNPGLNWLFVNDGSTDQTLQVLQSLREKGGGRVQVHSLKNNSGKGEAVRQGLLEGLKREPEIIGYFDADLATPIEELERLIHLFSREQKQVLLGSRVFLLGRAIERKKWRFWLGRSFALVASQLLGLKVYDTQCGAKLFLASESFAQCLNKPFFSRWLFDVELLQRLMGLGGLTPQDFFEEPLLRWTDVGGSKVKFRSVLVALWDLIKIYWHSR